MSACLPFPESLYEYCSRGRPKGTLTPPCWHVHQREFRGIDGRPASEHLHKNAGNGNDPSTSA
eukprot:5584368-Alexandrium_andersonii.AAC.1